MDAILHLPPDLPPHDHAPLEPVPHHVIAEWPVGTFLENLVVLDDGSIAVSVLSEARLDRVTLDGTVTTLIQFEAPPTGIALLRGTLYAAVGEPGGGEPTLWRIDPATGAGAPVMELTGMVFANGVTPFDAGRLLIADSWHGSLHLVDPAKRTIDVWLQDELLTRAPGMDFLPGANGVKRYLDHVAVSSNGRALLLSVAVDASGNAGPLTLLAERVRADDIAFDVAGDLYLTTHIGHSLDRRASDGTRIALAGPDQGMAGSTACAFGRRGAERSALYVTTTGGIVGPVDGILQPARLVRLDIGAEGYPLPGDANA